MPDRLEDRVLCSIIASYKKKRNQLKEKRHEFVSLEAPRTNPIKVLLHLICCAEMHPGGNHWQTEGDQVEISERVHQPSGRIYLVYFEAELCQYVGPAKGSEPFPSHRRVEEVSPEKKSDSDLTAIEHGITS